jgi:hypothetical protein
MPRARALLTVVAVLSLAATAEAAKKIKCAAADASCLVAAIAEANAGSREVVIQLAAGVYTLDPASAPDLLPGGLQNTGSVTIRGAGADATVIERASGSPPFRIIDNRGTLTIEKVTIRGGDTESLLQAPGGGGIANASGATLTIVDSRISENKALKTGGGVMAAGTVTIVRSSISNNQAQDGAGIAWSGTSLVITDSAITGNVASAFGGGIFKPFAGDIAIVNSTIAANRAPFGGAIQLGVPDAFTTGPTGLVTIANSTLAGNGSLVGAGGLSGAPFAQNRATATLASTILASNSTSGFGPSDCGNVVLTSGGHNLIEHSSCPGSLLASDVIADALLGALVVDGPPGFAHLPLLAGSPAIDAGGVAPRRPGRGQGTPAHGHHGDADADCPREDQIGEPRVGACDIGAIEFQPPTDVVAVAGATYVKAQRLLFVTATSSDAPRARLFLTVPGCLTDVRMQHAGNTYVFIDQVRGCGNLDGKELTVRSSGGGEGTETIR